MRLHNSISKKPIAPLPHTPRIFRMHRQLHPRENCFRIVFTVSQSAFVTASELFRHSYDSYDSTHRMENMPFLWNTVGYGQ
jgi:hypothetical protein